MKRFNVKRKSVPKTLSEKIHAQLGPEPSRDAADDSGDEETRPKFSEFDENDAELERAAGGGLSEIRKRNVEYLDAVDRKYQGKVSSRKEVFEDDDDVEEDSEQDESSEDDDHQPGAFVKLKQYQSSDEAENNNESEEDYEEDAESEEDEEGDSDEDDDDDEEDEEDEDENDFSLGDFLGKDSTDSQKLLRDENVQDSVQKGICVQNQLKLWERLLEMRIKMQPCLITANAFPHDDQISSFCDNEKFKEATQRTVDTVESTLKNLLQLQEALAGQFSETKDLLKSGSKRKSKSAVSNGRHKNARLDDYESWIGDNFVSFKPYRNDVLQRWDDRAKASSNVKNVHQSLSVIKKIENGMLAKDELIRKTQLYRGGYKLFAQPMTAKEGQSKECGEEPEPIYDEEIFDDSDFYHALLRELIEYKSNTTENPQQINAKLAELQKLRSKMKKQVDTRASKGRKIRYVVHKKLVNFTAPDDKHAWTEEAKNELFSSLFGGTNVSTEG